MIWMHIWIFMKFYNLNGVVVFGDIVRLHRGQTYLAVISAAVFENYW